MPPDEEAVEQPQDTAADEATSEEETPAEEAEPAVDYEKRYTDLRPEYDRNQQRLSEYEQFIGHLRDPETQAEALQALGLQLEEDEEPEDDEYDDPEERLEAELEGVKEYLAEQQQAQQFAEHQEREVDYVDDAITELEDEESIELSDKEFGVVVRLADTMRDENGWPDVRAAWEALGGISEAQRKRYVESKKANKPSANGTAGTEKIDMADEDERVKAFANVMEAEAQDS
jgi:DNA gyrase/topoisomerase IV subunit A